MIYKKTDLYNEFRKVWCKPDDQQPFLFLFFSYENEKMVEQQILIDQLKEKLEKFMVVKTWDFSSACGDGPAVTASARRPYSVPLTKSLLHSLYPSSGTETRKVRST